MTSSHDMLRRYCQALRDLARHDAWRQSNRQAALAALTEVASRSLEVDRVGVWIFDPSRSKIVCEELFEASHDRHTSGGELGRCEFEPYFGALFEERSMTVADAVVDPRTSCLARSYLRPLGIGALLDAPIFVEGHCVGVVCHEHVGSTRVWRQEEKSFSGSIADFAALAIEIDERRQAEEERRESETQLRLALAAARMGTWTWDLRTDLLEWSDHENPYLAVQHGEKISFSEFLSHVHPEDRALLERVTADAIEQRIPDCYAEYRLVWANGTVRWVESRGRIEIDADGTPRRMLGTTTDIDDRKRFEEELRGAQRLEALGRLAGGVAHDFNNLLTVIRCSVRGLRRDDGTSPRKVAQLENIEEATQRASDLVSQLLAFARAHPRRSQRVEVDGLIADLGGLLRRILGEQIDVSFELGGQGLAVDMDPSQLEQVVVNLALNARDAMPGGGSLAIRTSRAAENGLPVTIEVRDDGPGIPPSVLPHIFEPFFTTKELGKGTGLGLSTCYGIVHQTGGTIEVDTAMGAGTTFTVRLPLAADRPDAAADSGNTILLVEDEPLVRDIAESILRDAGFHVVAADRGEMAVERARRLEGPVDAIVADVVLPGLKGTQLIEALRAHSPEAPVLFISGYAPTHGPWERLERARFLRKPFTPEQLVGELRALLAEGRVT